MRFGLVLGFAIVTWGCEKPAPVSPQEDAKVEAKPAPYVDRKNAELKELKIDVQNTVDSRSADIEARADSPEN